MSVVLFVTTVFPVAGYIGDVPVILAKPQTFMNLSGESICKYSVWRILRCNDAVGQKCLKKLFPT
jgi:peptidyl-tRNA hydrolase